LQDKTAYDLMDKKVVAVSDDASILATARLIETSNVGLLPVVNDGRLVGIIEGPLLLDYILKHTEEELDGKTIKPLVKKPVFVVKEELASQVVAKIIRNNLTRIPVVDSEESMQCIGVISASDVLKTVG